MAALASHIFSLPKPTSSHNPFLLRNRHALFTLFARLSQYTFAPAQQPKMAENTLNALCARLASLGIDTESALNIFSVSTFPTIRTHTNAYTDSYTDSGRDMRTRSREESRRLPGAAGGASCAATRASQSKSFSDHSTQQYSV